MTSGCAARYSGRESPIRKENPTIKRFLGEFMLTCCNVESPTADTIPADVIFKKEYGEEYISL